MARGTTRLVADDTAVPWKPAPYQHKAMKFLIENPCAGLFLDPGLRKTSTTLGAIKVLKKAGVLDKVLIVAPLRVCHSVWPAEIAKWKDFNHLKCVVLHGTKKEEALNQDADIYLINPEGLDWLFGVSKVKVDGKKKRTITYDLKRFKKLGIDTLVIDEISKFKRAGSERFAVIKPILDFFDRRWGLTGSPASNGLMDLFGIMYMLDQGQSLGQYITHYRSAYFTPIGFGGYTWVLQPGAEKRIYERIAPIVFRLSGEDYVKLPKLVENVIKVELPEKARKIYDELEGDFITEVEKNIVTAVNAGVASGKCRQVANGGLYYTQEVDEQGVKQGKREWADLHDAKIEAVRDLVEELNGQPVIIAYDYEHDLARLLKEFGKDTPVIGGGVNPKKSDAIVKLWNAGKIPVLLVHPAAVAHGLNMQEGNSQHIILHSLTWDFELFDQLLRRLRRSGNTADRVFVHFIIAKDTIDEAVVIALRKKDRVQSDLLSALRDYTKAKKRTKKVVVPVAILSSALKKSPVARKTRSL